jgi:hypothetical protein
MDELLKEWAVIHGKEKKPLKNPPKIGRNFCNNICHRYATAKPRTGGRNKTKGDPYETHSYCRKCGGVWMPKSVIVKGIRCPCCNQRVANKSRSSKARGNEKKVYL